MESNIVLFFVTVVSLIIVPGPDMLYVTSRALADGRSSGIKAAIGISGGYLVFTILVSLGLGTVFETNPRLFLALKLSGMVYLIYLAYRLFVADIVAFAQNGDKVESSSNEVKYGFLTSVLNPKGLIFYFALLPQFYVPSVMAFWTYALIFGTITSLLCFIIYSAVGVLVSDRGHELIMSHRNGWIISKLASLSVFLIALSIIISDVLPM